MRSRGGGQGFAAAWFDFVPFWSPSTACTHSRSSQGVGQSRQTAPVGGVNDGLEVSHL